MRRLAIAIGVVVLASVRACAAELPTAEQLLKKVTAAFAEMQSLEADMRGTGSMGWKEAGHLAMERSEKDGKTICRAWAIVQETWKESDGKEESQESSMVNDGTFTWTERRIRGKSEIRVEKVDSQEPNPLGPGEGIMRDIREDWQRFHLSVVGEDKIDGEKMYVLEGALPAADLPKYAKESKMKVWISQDDLMMRRIVDTVQLAKGDHSETNTVEFRNVKVNQKVDPALFIYTPPEGAKVNDRTKPKP